MTRSRSWFYVPLVVFIVLAGLLAYSLRHSGEDRPSAQLNRPFPAFQLPALNSKETLLDAGLMKGRVTLVNVWGSWCPNCEEEMDVLHALAQEHTAIVGINYKDTTDGALTFLQRFGNPYDTIIDDHAGDLAFELGVYGAPETFVVDANGVIRYHHAGALTSELVAQDIMPLLKALAP